MFLGILINVEAGRISALVKSLTHKHQQFYAFPQYWYIFWTHVVVRWRGRNLYVMHQCSVPGLGLNLAWTQELSRIGLYLLRSKKSGWFFVWLTVTFDVSRQTRRNHFYN